MENYGSYYFNENHGRPGSHPSPYPPPPNFDQPPPPSPHIYPQFPYGSGNNYTYHSSQSFPNHPPYPHSGPTESPSSHSGPLPPYVFPHSQPQYPFPGPNFQPQPQVPPNPSAPNAYPYPNFQYQGSFQYSSSFYHHSQSFEYPPQEGFPAPRPDRDTDYYYRRESSSSVAVGPSHQELVDGGSPPRSSSSLYPLDDLLAGVRLSDRSDRTGTFSGSNSFNSSLSPRSDLEKPSAIYAYPNHSFPARNDPYGPEALTVQGDSLSQPSSASSSFNSSRHDQNLQVVPYSPSKASLKVLLLHGTLDIWIFEAKNLPNMDMFHKTISDMFGKRVSSSVASVTDKLEDHMARTHSITSDPYVTVSISNAVIARTYVISNNENPDWMQHSCVPVAHHAAELRFMVKDNDVVGSQLIGVVAIPTEQICSVGKVEGSFPILGTNGKPCKQGATIRLSIQYTPVDQLTMYQHGVGFGSDCHGVPNTYFPLRKGGKVTLYQDAHVPEGCLPDLKLDRNIHYEHGKCWQDICEAIKQARRLIYITGWSVYHKVRLVRDESYSSGITLGDLLKTKSQEGVRVLLLVWDDPTSRSIFGLQTDGLMATHDEETRKFFKHSSVQVLLCPRAAGKRHSWLKQQEVGTIYTHHQKTVIVDSDAGNNKRKIIAFVGGLDLCDGRYDTPKHPLFRTLQTLHKDDYHNPTFADPDMGGPREPWHDLHCKIDGPAAYDVLTNFEQRWSKSSKPRGISKLKRSFEDTLLKINRIPDIAMPETLSLNENDPETWHVQVFRSIDSTSVKGFPKDPRDATSKNLVCGKNALIDMSIHTAYVKAIRAAQHFIYIENQYFLGSSYNWSSHNDLGADNLIPMEIALKIANKIKANERFSAYIVIPMWPEGVPTGVATQRILFWQNKTMQMMYDTIYKALEEAGLEKTYGPQDYLNFFCLGNREAPDGNNAPSAPQNTPHAQAQRSRRFMIYVHSKGMIVDDEYVILGSANINQRSMEGTRDTEIAMGAYQPQHTWASKLSNPRGQIYGYRMSLWAEHIGVIEDCFTHPESVECVRRVKAVGEFNWKQFAANEISEIRGHLLKYPVEVDAKGKVKAIPGCETFPDVGGNILGSFLVGQENLTI